MPFLPPNHQCQCTEITRSATTINITRRPSFEVTPNRLKTSLANFGNGSAYPSRWLLLVFTVSNSGLLSLFSSCDRELWPITLTSELYLDSVKYLGESSLSRHTQIWPTALPGPLKYSSQTGGSYTVLLWYDRVEYSSTVLCSSDCSPSISSCCSLHCPCSFTISTRASDNWNNKRSRIQHTNNTFTQQQHHHLQNATIKITDATNSF